MAYQSLPRVSPRSAGVQIAEHAQFGWRGRWSGFELRGHLERPACVREDLLQRNARMHAGKGKLARDRIRCENPQIGDDRGWPLTR